MRTLAEAEVVEAPGCDPGVSEFESRPSPQLQSPNRQQSVVLVARDVPLRLLYGGLRVHLVDTKDMDRFASGSRI